jgi:NAD-dependent SIR2 family protein deacetylase
MSGFATYINCVYCHHTFKEFDGWQHSADFVGCPRCKRLLDRPKVKIESDARKRKRERAEAEKRQRRLF